jgi:hypothetical protein
MRVGPAILRQLVPGVLSLVLAALGVAMFVLWGLLALAMVVDPLDDQTMVGAAAVVGAVFFAPLGACFFAFAGLVDRRLLARAAWFWLAASSILGAGVLLGVAMAFEPVLEGIGPVDGESLGLGIFGGTCCGFGPMCVFLLPAIAFTAKGLGQIRRGSTPDALDALVELLQQRGYASFAEITATSGIEAHRIEPVLFELRSERRLFCRVEPQTGWVCTEEHERRGLRALPGLVTARARIGLEELGRELNAPPALLRAWIYRAVGAGELQGYMDWNKGIIYSREARVLKSARRCPGCAGKLELVGRGVVQCPYCDTEIFL